MGFGWAQGTGSIISQVYHENLWIFRVQALDEDWNDEAVNVLLAQADASGDGELQFQEFVSWVFAEDPSTLGRPEATGDFTLVISGASREFLNNEYVQEKGRILDGRPVFYCAASKRFLFYHQKTGAWHVNHKLNELSSCCLETKRAAHIADAKWKVWQRAEKHYVEESSVMCKILLPDPEQELAKAPLILRPLKGEAYGTFTRRDPWTVDGRPLYFCGQNDTFLIYVEKAKKWKVCKVQKKEDGSDGFVTAHRKAEGQDIEFEAPAPTYMRLDCRLVDPTNTEEKYDWKSVVRMGMGFSISLGCSEETTSYSPEKATWHHPEEGYLFEWEVVDAKPNPNPEAGWCDPSFPHDSLSLGDPAKSNNNLERILASHRCP